MIDPKIAWLRAQADSLDRFADATKKKEQADLAQGMALAHRAYADALEEEPEPEPEPEFPWPLAGEVGCQFDEADLDVIEPPNGVLVVNEPTTIDHAYVKGGINFGGHGQLTIRNSIIEGGYGWDRHIQAYQPDSRVEVTDTTIRSLP